MGIKGFRGWFESTFPNSMTPINTSPSSILKHKQEEKKKKKQLVYDSETFDHVLIDVNQLLHVSLRRARNEGHALTMVIKELDKCLHLAQPTKSVVLALDGPPSAAKLATQRRRRYGLVVRAAWKRERRKLLEERIQKVNDDGVSYKNLLLPSKKRKQRYRVNEEQTLCITPGTAFMDRAADAILYWTWQRLTNPTSLLRRNHRNVKVYLSTSDSPGEGEVKLLDWVFQLGGEEAAFSNENIQNHPKGISISTRKKRRVIKPGDSIAIMGGDSDLVLEGLILPPSITHNVFVILPDGNKKSYSVSLWETTLELLKFLPHRMKSNSDSTLENNDSTNIAAQTNTTAYPWSEEELIMNVRTDLVLLLIMNGNDYLPKLRGSSGFNKLFHTYLKLLRQWLDVKDKQKNECATGTENEISDSKSSNWVTNRPFLINRDNLSFNIPFCLAFFRQLEQKAPKFIDQSEDILSYSNKISKATPLGIFNNMIDSGFIPKPAVWNFVQRYTDGFEVRMTLDKMNFKKGKKQNYDEFIELTLGDPNSKTSPNYSFEIKHEKYTSFKTMKHRLASLAMDEILGSDWKELNEFYIDTEMDDDDDVDDDDEDDDDEEEDENDDDDDEDQNDDDDDSLDYEAERGMISSSGYAWEVNGPVNCDVEQYLAGILWNLQTYQDGVCADYSYNYGRRMSPTAAQIVEYLTNFTAGQNNSMDSIGREELLGDNFTEPLDAGLSCLAALPAQAKHLVPEPYNLLTLNDTVEEIYGECMDSDSNVFDIKLFKERCNELIEEKLDHMDKERNNTDLVDMLNDLEGNEPDTKPGNRTVSKRQKKNR